MGVLSLPPGCPAGPEGSTSYRLSISRTWRDAEKGHFVFPFPKPQLFLVNPVEQIGNLSATNETGYTTTIPVSSLGLYHYTGTSAGATLVLMGSADRLVAVALDNGVRELRQVNDTHQTCFFGRAVDFVSLVNEDDAVVPDLLPAAAELEPCKLECLVNRCPDPTDCSVNPCEQPEVSCLFYVSIYGDEAWCVNHDANFAWATKARELLGIADAVFQNSGTLARIAAGNAACNMGPGNAFDNTDGCNQSWLNTFAAGTAGFFTESDLAILFVGQQLNGGYCGFSDCPGPRSIQFDTTLDPTLHGLNIAHEFGHNFRGSHQTSDFACFDSSQQADSVSNPAHCPIDHSDKRADLDHLVHEAVEEVSRLTRPCYDAMWSDGGDLSTRVPWFSDGVRNDNGALRNNVRFMDCEAAYKITLDSSWRSCPLA